MNDSDKTELIKLVAEMEKRVAPVSPFYMAKYIMGRSLFKEGRPWGWNKHHLDQGRLMWWAYKTRQERPWGTWVKTEWARDTRKSTLAAACAVCMLLDNENLRILYDSDTDENAEKKLSVIRQAFEDTYFIERFGDRKSIPWTSSSITIKRSAKLSDPSVTATGLKAEKTSRHFDVIIPDDIQTDGNSGSREAIDDVKNNFRLYESLGTGPYLLLYFGTRWAFKDVGEMIEEIATDDQRYGRPKRIFISKLAAYKKNKDGSFNYNEAEFPEILSLEILKFKRASMGAEAFSFNYLLEPLSDETAWFKRQDIQYHEKSAADMKGCHFYAFVDPARSKRKTADFTSIPVVAVTEFSDLYLMEIVNKRLSEEEIFLELERICRQYPMNGVMIEELFQQYQLAARLKDRSKQSSVPIPWRKFKRDNRSKADRIASLRPYFEGHKVFIRRGMTEFEDQLLKYPRSENDDMVDGLASILKMMYVPGKKDEKDWWKKEDWAEEFVPTEKRPALPTVNEIRVWRTVDARKKNGPTRIKAIPLSAARI